MSRFSPRKSSNRPDGVERLISGFCYLSMGLVGLLYIVISGKKEPSDFFRFHFIQSIILGGLFFLCGFTGSIFANILGGVFGLIHLTFADTILFWVGQFWYYAGCLFCILLVYGGLFALFGKHAEVPIVSRLVRTNMQRY